MDTPVPYHCPKCRSSGQQATFTSLPELRQHVLRYHFAQDASNSPVPMETSTPILSPVPSLGSSKPEARSGTRGIHGISDPEQLAQAKKYLLVEAMRSSELNRVQIRQLNEEIKNKESHLDNTSKKLSSLVEKNQSMEHEFDKMEGQNKEIRRELDELKIVLIEKEKMLEEKNRELAEQLNYMKSIEEKEAQAKDRLQKTVEKIIERAETAEKNLELMKLSAASSNNPEGSSRSKAVSRNASNMDIAQRNAELQNVLESCNYATDASYQQTSASNPDELHRLLTPQDPKQSTTPLAQIYLKNFLEKYNELKAREYAFVQTYPALSLHPQTPGLQPFPSSTLPPGETYYPPYHGYPKAQAGQYPPVKIVHNQEMPESDGSKSNQNQSGVGDEGYPMPSKKISVVEEWSGKSRNAGGGGFGGEESRSKSPQTTKNLNNSNNYGTHSNYLTPNSSHKPVSKKLSRSLFPDDDADADDDDDWLTEVSSQMNDDEDAMPYGGSSLQTAPNKSVGSKK